MIVGQDDQDDRGYQYHTSIPIDEEKRQRKKLEQKLEQKRKKGKKIVGRRDM